MLFVALECSDDIDPEFLPIWCLADNMFSKECKNKRDKQLNFWFTSDEMGKNIIDLPMYSQNLLLQNLSGD